MPVVEPELRAAYIQLGREVVARSLEFASKPRKPKQCDRGLSCKNACVDPRKSCDAELSGQAKTYASWLQSQISKGAGGTNAGAKPKDTGENDPETFHGWLIYKGKETLGADLVSRLDEAFKTPQGLVKLKNDLVKAEAAFDKVLDELGDENFDTAVKTPEGRKYMNVANRILKIDEETEAKRQAIMSEVQQRLLETGMPREDALRLAYSVAATKDVVKAYGGDREALNEELADYFQITNGAGAESLKKIVVDDDRPYADPDSGKLNLGGFESEEERRGTIFHEVAHHAEASNEFTRQAMVSWVQWRAESQQQQAMNEIIGKELYGDDERAYKDKWVSAYVGKTYRDEDDQDYFTEALSVGTEHLINPASMSKLYRKDPNHFWLTIGAYRDND